MSTKSNVSFSLVFTFWIFALALAADNYWVYMRLPARNSMRSVPFSNQRYWLQTEKDHAIDRIRNRGQYITDDSSAIISIPLTQFRDTIKRSLDFCMTSLAFVDEQIYLSRKEELDCAYIRTMESQSYAAMDDYHTRTSQGRRLGGPSLLIPGSHPQQFYNDKVQQTRRYAPYVESILAYTGKQLRKGHSTGTDLEKLEDMTAYAEALLNFVNMAPHTSRYQSVFGSDFVAQVQNPWGPQPE